MAYQHAFLDSGTIDLPVGKVVCIGRNYAAHAAELNNPVPTEPLLFMKPSTAIVPMTEEITLPKGQGSVHYETEMAILIGETLTNVDNQGALHGIAGVGVALDLTLRDLQSKLKEKGHPWEKAKAFDGACPLSPFLRTCNITDLGKVQVRLTINGEVRQDGNTDQMLTPVLELISYISRSFTLQPGDVVLTGTPAGVGELPADAELKVELVDLLRVETRTAAN